MPCRPMSRQLTPSSGPLRTRAAHVVSGHHWVCSPVPGSTEETGEPLPDQDKGPRQAIGKVSLTNRLQLRRPHATGSPEAPFPSPNKAPSRGTRRSVIRKKHKVPCVPDWLPANDLPTFPRAQLPPQAEKGIIKWQPWTKKAGLFSTVLPF